MERIKIMLGKNIQVICISALVAFSYSGQANSGSRKTDDSLQGAARVLESLSTKPATKKKVSPLESYFNELKIYRASSAKMSPKKAAKKWLSFVDRWLALEATNQYTIFDEQTGNYVDIKSVLASLPEPSKWPALINMIRNMKPGNDGKALHASLLFLAAVLEEDQNARLKAINYLKSVAADKDARKRATIEEIAYNMAYEISLDKPGKAGLIQLLEKRIGHYRVSSRSGYFNVPDLNTLVGKKESAKFIKKALLTPNVLVQVSVGDKTRKTASELALKHVNELKLPQWRLAHDIHATKLFEALSKTFLDKSVSSGKTGSPYANKDYILAQKYYVLGLIVSKRHDEAVDIAYRVLKVKGGFPSKGLEALEEAGYTRNIYAFIKKLLEKNPELQLWDTYIELSAKIRQTKTVVAFIDKALKRKNLSNNIRRSLLHAKINAQLADDKTEQAVASIKKYISANPTKHVKKSDDLVENAKLGLKLAEVGRLLGKPVWTDKGLAYAIDSYNAIAPGGKNRYKAENLPLDISALMRKLNRHAGAEKLLVRFMRSKLANSGDDEFDIYSKNLSSPLTELVSMYFELGRYQDVITLMGESEYWGIKDLSGIIANKDEKKDYLGYFVAYSLNETGKKAESLAITKALLNLKPGYDPAYQLFLDITKGKDAAFLDSLYKRDQFEERPLIWKASLALQNGKYKDAEELAKQAISIDPSDGEQGPDRRMRVYTILANARAKQGDKKTADIFHGAVKAIRISEKADEYYEAGMLSRGIKMYKRALTHFSDAYCIQSRLAIQLSEAGQLDQAAKHYQRAYELMPESFGRLESHCFGCQKVFKGSVAQGVAERVFSKLLKSTPKKPQVHYMFGYLRKEQNEWAEALGYFKKAVKLDPEYLNAWKQIYKASERTYVNSKERDKTILKMLELDPLRKHVYPKLEEVDALKELWKKVEIASSIDKGVPNSLYPLTKSGRYIDKKMEKLPESQRSMYSSFSSYSGGENSQQSPGAVIAKNNWMKIVAGLIDEKYRRY